MALTNVRERRSTPHAPGARVLDMRDAWRALDRCAAPMFALDRAGHVVAWNAACVRGTGHAKAEVIGRRLWKLRFIEAPQWQHAWQTGNIPNDLELRVLRPDGSTIALGCVLDVRRARDGAIIDVVATAGDLDGVSSLEVDERRRYEEELRAHERTLSTLIEVLPVGLWVCDARGQIVSANTAAQRLWGGVRYVGIADYGLYRSWWVDSGKPIAAGEWALERAVRDGETSSGELIRIEAFDGNVRTILNSATPLRDGDGAIVGAVLVQEDVSPLRDAEELLRRTLMAQREIQRIVSHDLRGPLSGILLTVAATLRTAGASLHPATTDSLHVIERSGKRMRRLLDDLLDAARIEDGALVIERKAELLRPWLEEAVELAQPLAAGRTIRLEAPATLPQVDADQHRVLQVLDNLLANAIKFTDESGRLVVRAVPLDDGFVEISVTDDGRGISEAHLPRVFERFWQGDRRDCRGFGLGLAICKSIVEAHGGRIVVTSAPGLGSTFRFTLPVASRGTSDAPSRS
jgi:PAS domain S-box-containing protein